MARRVSIYDYKGEAFIMSGSKSYGFFNFVLDAFLTLATGGLWLIWIFVREIRKG